MFWGVVFILAGILLLGHQMDYIPGDFWDYFWPVILIAFGVKVLFDHKSTKVHVDD